MASIDADALSQDFFWFIVNPEQHTRVLDQKRVDYTWRAKQTPWNSLINAIPQVMTELEKDGSGVTNVARKRIAGGLRGKVKHDSRNMLDLDIERLLHLGILQREKTGYYRFSKLHLEAATPYFVECDLPRVLENHGEDTGLEDRIQQAARKFKAKVDVLPSNGASLRGLVDPYVPRPGPQGRRNAAYTTAYLLWRLVISHLDWDGQRHWLEPATIKVKDVKQFLRKFGLRTGNQALQECVDLGRACGLFVDARRGELRYFPGMVLAVNRLMWELIPGTITTVPAALPIANGLRSAIASSFGGDGFAFAVAENWRATAGWKFVPSKAAANRNYTGTFVAMGQDGISGLEVACPIHFMTGALSLAVDQSIPPTTWKEEDWWGQIMHRSEGILAHRPEWGAFMFPVPPAVGNPDTSMEATKWRPEENGEHMYLDLVASSIEYGYVPEAIVFIEGLKDQERSTDFFHRMEMRVVTLHNEFRMTCDFLKENDEWVPQLWMPLPPNKRTGFYPLRLRMMLVAATIPKIRLDYVEKYSKEWPEKWAKRKAEIARPPLRDKKGRALPYPREPEPKPAPTSREDPKSD